MFHTNLRLVVGEQPAITEVKVRIQPPGGVSRRSESECASSADCRTSSCL